MTDLDHRLVAMYSHRGDGVPTQYVNPDGPEALDEIVVLRARVAEMEGALSDPNAVHLNMLRGGIAKPSIRQFIHIYGEDAVRAALQGDA